MEIGRRLNENELGSKWADCEPTVIEGDSERIERGRKLENMGFSLLADPTGENFIDDSFCVVTPNNVVLTPYEVYAFDKIGLPELSPRERQEMKNAHEYLLAYSPTIF